MDPAVRDHVSQPLAAPTMTCSTDVHLNVVDDCSARSTTSAFAALDQHTFTWIVDEVDGVVVESRTVTFGLPTAAKAWGVNTEMKPTTANADVIVAHLFIDRDAINFVSGHR